MIYKDGKLAKSFVGKEKSFVGKVAPGKIKHGRLQQPAQLTDEERKEFRSICGCLQWLGGQTRPELCAATSLAHRVV